jgi:hypothetical protein
MVFATVCIWAFAGTYALGVGFGIEGYNNDGSGWGGAGSGGYGCQGLNPVPVRVADTVLALALLSLLEGFTEQIDNLLLPVFAFVTFTMAHI